jgi:formylglycine-generating enzyme required for sulfatase activity
MDSAKQLEHLFSQAKTQTVFASCDEVKEQFQHSSALGSAGATSKIVQFLLTYKWIFMLVIISTAAALLLLPSNPTSSKDFQKSSLVELDQVMDQVAKIEKSDDEEKEASSIVQFSLSEETQPDPTVSLEIPSGVEEEIVPKEEEVVPNVVNKDEPKKEVEAKQTPLPYFPKLTEKEIAENNKRKKKMIKRAFTLNNKEYAYLPSSSFRYGEDTLSVQAFYMQKTEVSNIQYKTFLFDLLIQGKKEDFQIAKPEQQLWTEMLGSEYQEMRDNYFSGEEWEEYPVVNVSREGAMLYCKWLSEECRTQIKGKMPADFRLPTKVEWTMAASVEGKMMPYPWGGPSTKNEKGCYLANFNAPNSVVATKGSSSVQSDGAPIIAATMTYNPNEFGLYNMSGNVAEMVQINPSKDSHGDYGTAGGGWMNSAEELKIDGNDPYEGRTEGHPNIGFRVIMSYLGTR